MEVKPVHQNRFGLSFGASQTVGEGQRAGVEIDADFLGVGNDTAHTATLRALATNASELGSEQLTDFAHPRRPHIFGIVSLSPVLSLCPRGAGGEPRKQALRPIFQYIQAKAVRSLAPDVVLFAVNPASGFGAWLSFEGGEHLNTLARLTQFTP